MLPMDFLSDLDPLAWAAMLVAVVVFCSVMFLNVRDWRNHWKIEVDGRAGMILILSVAFLVGAINSYSPNANAPRKTVEGIARFVAEAQGRHRYDKYICATSCRLTSGYALDLRDDASDFVRIGSPYVFTYLEKPAGGVFSGISLRVIAISEPESGRVLYALDLANHPYRIVAYLLDAALLICAGLFGGILNRSRRHEGTDKNDSNEDEQTEEEEQAPDAEPISLKLD